MMNVIIPSGNGPECLKRALDSLVCQTKLFFIVTIIDDSTGTIDKVVDDYKDRLNISYIKNTEMLGPGLSRQAGLDHLYKKMDNGANFDYVMFLDDDDILYPRAVEILEREAKITNADVLFSVIHHESKGAPGHVLALGKNTTWTHGKAYKLEFLRDNDIRFLSEIIYNEDSYFNLVVALLSKKSFFVNETTYLWKDNPNSLTRKNKLEFIKNSNWQYIYGQCAAILKLLPNLSDYSRLIPTIIHIYEKYQIEIGLVRNNTKCIDEKILEIFTDRRIIEIFSNPKNRNTLCKSLHSGEVIDNKPFIYPYNFIEWLSSYNNPEVNKISEYFRSEWLS